MTRKSKKLQQAQVNPELAGFHVNINEFGEIISNIDVGVLNTFLDKTVEDKKFKGIDISKRVEPEKPVEDVSEKTW